MMATVTPDGSLRGGVAVGQAGALLTGDGGRLGMWLSSQALI